MRYQIYWTANTELKELQGADLDFQALNAVNFKHQFLPSGRVVAVWHSQHNYMRDKAVADLPRLVQGRTYTFRRHIDHSERMFAYLSVTFFDQQGQNIANKSQNADEIEVTVPDNYAAYQVELVSAGAGDFTFHDFTISTSQSGQLKDGDQALDDNLFSYLQADSRVKGKNLRVVFTEPELYQTNYVDRQLADPEQPTLYFATDLLHSRAYTDQDLIEPILQARKQSRSRDLEFIGYGPVSSQAAVYYQAKFKNSQALIFDPRFDPAVPFQNLLPSDIKQFLASLPGWIMDNLSDGTQFVEQPDVLPGKVNLIVPHPVRSRLSMLPTNRTKTIPNTVPATRVANSAARQEPRHRKNRLNNFFTNGQ
ncbi:accessory Sec system protein Asp3 [Lactobacillaceae bacterium L1_55_11]|nr:accessory Sec system protein Asp3 [Lactobacillaceae bacterium L1_55_11]